MATKRKLAAMGPGDDEPVDPSDELSFVCLGGGNEVGRSCHIIQYKGKTVMLDAGMHPAYEGLAALPFYDEFDLSTVDVLLISHFHVDHAASLPYVLAKTNFKGKVYMTHATKAIYKWIIQDSVRLGNAQSSSEQKVQLYTEADHLATFDRIEAIGYHTTHFVSSIRITPYPAGHVLGAAMFLIEIAGLNILFTGDYSREQDRHLISAEIPKNVKIDVLITESTFGISSHIPRLEREAALMKSITGILNRGGRALLPVFALGRAQELLLILEEYWGKHPEYSKYPIYYASNLARKCMTIYQTFIDSMNDNIKRMFQQKIADSSNDDQSRGGPWDFKYVRSLKSLDRFDDVGGCVILATPGMMQNGVSRELLERWAPDPKNGIVMTGYSVEGTMGKLIMNEPDQITAVMTKRTNVNARGVGREGEQILIPRRCSVHDISFAAHVSGVENKDFIEEVAAPVVILVHGEKHNMMRLKSKLLSLNSDKALPVKVYSPANCEDLRIPFKTEKVAKVVGKLASIPPTLAFRSKTSPESEASESVEEHQPQIIQGVLVQNDFKMSLMAPEDLREYAGLSTTTIMCRQRITLSAAGVALIHWALEGTFGAVSQTTFKDEAVNGKREAPTNGHRDVADEEISRETTAFKVMDCVTVKCGPAGAVEVEWEGNMVNDGIADAVLAVLFSVESSPAAVKQSSSKQTHSHMHSPSLSPPGAQKPIQNPHASPSPSTRLSRLCMFLEAQFGSSAVSPIPHPRISNPSSDPSNPDETTELKRLHALGIPIPGILIKVDKQEARIWLEELDVEASSAVLRERVRAVVERAVEVVSPMWG
ncbi:metallo-beta-lactamase superfamily protein [Patellaria atrata CBS 101060]|uniref:Metallo-beta-lactamase superfamily protein n=1 Tax=Patellaria atrata CBS 101060 TaxID=1346257 RepID=A0A9P4VXC0_9PEZI|nr:metallo-beta-lactamase superfamily protein [Patellaria atrata CBS 101060]